MSNQIQTLVDSLNSIVNSDSVLYTPAEVKDLTGLTIVYSIPGDVLTDYVYSNLENLGWEPSDEEVQVLEVPAQQELTLPVNNQLIAAVPANSNLIKSRYLEGKSASFLSANNLQINKKLAVKTRDGHRLLSEQSQVLNLLEETGYKHRGSLDKFNKAVDVLISNMVLHTRKNQWTRISLTESTYTGSDMSYTAIKNLVSSLEKAGQIEVIKGFNAKEGYKTGRSTCIRFHDESPVYQYICHQVAKDELRYNLDNKYVVLIRDNRKRVTLVEGDKIPAESVRLFDLYKNLAAQTTISIPTSVTSDPNVTFLPKMEYKNGNQGYCLDQLAPIHQVFNRKDLTTGGRFYSGICNLKKETRSSILFNGRLTSEVDFRACHLAILATQSNVSITKDPYTFGDIASRDTNKLFCLIAINAKSNHQMKQALGRKISDLGLEFTVEDWITSVSNKHPWLVPFFGTNMGSRLQNIESKIMAKAMIQFMSDKKSLVISIHDGCIVDRRYSLHMVDCLHDAFEAYFPRASKTVLAINCVVTDQGVEHFCRSERYSDR
jgi:hypothetical protein